jgi:2-oxo-3-hexenedioate decarboxylase
VIGAPIAVTDANRAELAAVLPAFEVTLSRGDATIDRGVGSNVLDSPALALVHLARLLADQPQAPKLAAGEIVTTGTITDAWPVAAG